MGHELRVTPPAPRLPWVVLGVALCLLPLPVAGVQAPTASLTPDKGPTVGGTRVLIEIDEGLTLGSIRVEFGGRPVRVVRGLGLSIVEVITPPGDPGPVPVRVTYGLLMKTAARPSSRTCPQPHAWPDWIRPRSRPDRPSLPSRWRAKISRRPAACASETAWCPPRS